MVSKEEILDDVRRVADEQDEPNIRQSTYNEHGEYYAKLVYRKFDTWNEMKEEAGLPTDPHRTSNEEIFEQMRMVAETVGYWDIRQTDLKEHGSVAVKTVHDRFDSWDEALRQAGLIPSEDALVMMLDRIEQMLEAMNSWSRSECRQITGVTDQVRDLKQDLHKTRRAIKRQLYR